MNCPVVSAGLLPPIRACVYRSNSFNAIFTARRCASRTRSSPPTSAVRDTDLGAEKVASPTGAMFNWRDRFSIGVRVSLDDAVTHKLLAGDRMLAVREPCKVLLIHTAGQPELVRQLAMPLAQSPVIPFPVIL